jgi:hypothetical protein
MADRFSLIYNSSAGQIQELSAGDNLDLTSSGIVNADIITATTFSGNLTGNLNGNLIGVAATAIVLGINTTSLNNTNFYVFGNSASNVVGVSTSTTITIDMTTSNNFSISLNGNYTLGNPTGFTTGQSGVVFLNQDSSGSRTLGFGTFWNFPAGVAPTLTTTANATDAIFYVVRNASSIVANSILNAS